ncbi:YdeI/OmpD-associated family protein [uncultured Arthrobacter sp.]|uniref:YdeI/OmpD-associated family protein n=1 Tax=uncultured Arthrobacter sp. TaxID=114050 RepID=UPI00261CD3A9|nr:YdeI/OmpD-associated family protein [uncultured Arthrobacter sp.]
MKFRAELESSGKNTAGFEVPESVVEQLGGGKHPKIVATVNGFTFRTSIASMGGRYLFGLSADRRREAGVQAGEVHDVEVELDTAPREVDLPEDLTSALEKEPAAKAFWDTLSYSNKSWHALQVTGAKKPETRAARIEKSIGMLREGRAR